ncbi:hypothetical protein AAF712_007815 [Marasmius tenuissimus]|uniref:Uncharacterized protein n=1 Tax=Marasmius tenuissimus TaxID=585030 RepID=A0ABR2ZTY6_9AGAR
MNFDWMEAMHIVQCVHKCSEDQFRVIPGHFSLPLTKLRKTLNGPFPTDPQIDYGYLESFGKDWGNVDQWNKKNLIEILSKHINEYPHSNAESSHGPGKLKISPLVMSPAGLELITLVNNHLAEERKTYQNLPSHNQISWRDAMEQVKVAYPGLPPDHFKDIVHKGIFLPPPRGHSPQQEAGVGIQAENSSGTTRDREADRNEQMEDRSDLKPSPQPEPGKLDEQGPLVGDAEAGKYSNATSSDREFCGW